MKWKESPEVFHSPWAVVCWVLAALSLLGAIANEHPLAGFAPWCFAVLALLIDVRGQLRLMTPPPVPPSLPPALQLPPKRERHKID